MDFSLIVPVAADSKEYDNQMPYVFGLNKQGLMHCVNAILGLNIEGFDNIYFTILKKHDRKYNISKMLDLQYKRLGLEKARTVILEEPTECQADTIFETIQKEEIKGSIFIKDADGYFEASVIPQNCIAVYPLEDMQFVNPQNKSYVAVDDMFYITNVIEKRVISHFFNAGGSCFKNASDFCIYYNKLKKYADKLYISHIIYAMLIDKKIFRPIEVSEFKDFGNDNLFNYYISSL